MTNFESAKAELNLKYRLGLEHALAKADFLNVPDLVLLQAFTIFLILARRHDSPRFVWMMTGLAIRMAQALGLQRDGEHFIHLTPFEIEMRRRIWWTLIMLDIRSSEDQGTDFTIACGSYDTKFPLNINDKDIDPQMTEMPTERVGITDMAFPLTSFQMGVVSRDMMAHSSKGQGVEGIAEQNRLLNEIYRISDRGYLQFGVGSTNIMYWVGETITRLVVDKMTLLIYLPILFTASNEILSETIKSKLLVAAIELAEYNHALNAEQECRHWRWLFQTYTHWYAVVYLLLEISRRPWSPINERAWVALHSEWLIPGQPHISKNLRVWVPLRKLMTKAGNYRESELARLRVDLQAAKQLEIDDKRISVPASPGPFPGGCNAADFFLQRWRQLVGIPSLPSRDKCVSDLKVASSVAPAYTTQLGMEQTPIYTFSDADNMTSPQLACGQATRLASSQNIPNFASSNIQPSLIKNAPGGSIIRNNAEVSYNAVPEVTSTWSMGPGFVLWTWPDADMTGNPVDSVDIDEIAMNMDLDTVDWYNWLESTKGMELDTRVNGSGIA